MKDDTLAFTVGRSSSADSTDEPHVLLVSEDTEPFLWEQIAASLDAVEEQEVRRVVGESIIGACEDIYAEVRALRLIAFEATETTDDVANHKESVGPPALGLLALEVKQLVDYLRSRARAAGVAEETLLPEAARSQHFDIDDILQDPASPRRPRTASLERSSLMSMRGDSRGSSNGNGDEGGFSRPGTSQREQSFSRGAVGGTSRPGSGGDDRSASLQSGSLGLMSRPASGVGSRPRTSSSAAGSRRASRPPTGPTGGAQSDALNSSRPATAASSCSEVAAEAVGARPGSAGGGVLLQLRAALEEERRALLAQTEQLHLAIQDELDFRVKAARPPPSLAQLSALKVALQEAGTPHASRAMAVAALSHARLLERVTQADHIANAPALRAAPLSRDRDRSSLSRFKPLGALGAAAESPHAAPAPAPPECPPRAMGEPTAAASPRPPPSGRSSLRLRSLVASANPDQSGGLLHRSY